MSIEEFMLAFASIVIGLGLSDLLVSFHRLLRSSTKVRWDWLTLAFAALMIFISIVMWWFSYLWFHGVASVTIANFLPKLVFLCVSFLMMAAALPDDVPTSGIDLRAFYMETRAHRWSLVATLLVLNIIWLAWSYWNEGLLAVIVEIWPVVISTIFAIICIRSTRVWLHSATILWLTAGTAASALFYPIGAAP